mmetsp:Transcript_4965/g.7680  ORF Transcript_4965/g.7680 Transcript_4965/m.7680 type:complete len:387 (+) Transcript_4965:66-1226(+)
MSYSHRHARFSPLRPQASDRSSSERGVSVQGPVTPSTACESVLKEHANDCHHCKPSVCELCRELSLPFLRVIGCKQRRLPAIVTWRSASNIRVVACLVLDKESITKDLQPAKERHLANGSQTVGHFSKLQTRAGRKIPRKLACDFRCDVAHGCQHANTAVLDLHGAAAGEGRHVAIGTEARWIPESQGWLDTKLALKSPQGGVSVQGPVSICTACESILEEHPDDRHHSQAAICKLCIQPFRLQLRVISCKQWRLEAAIPRCRAVLTVTVGVLAEEAIGHNLGPASSRNLGDSCEAIGDVCKLEARGWREVARELASKFWSYVSHGRQHADATVFDLCLPSPLENSNVSVGGEAQGIPEAHGCLHTELVLEGPQGRSRVECPVAPS